MNSESSTFAKLFGELGVRNSDSARKKLQVGILDHDFHAFLFVFISFIDFHKKSIFSMVVMGVNVENIGIWLRPVQKILREILQSIQ